MLVEENLYALSVNLKHELDSIIESDGELDEKREADLEKLMLLLETKTDACVGYYDSITDQIELIEKHVKSLNDLKLKLKSRQERYTEYLKNCLERSGLDEFKGNLSVIKRRKKTKVVEITDESKIPLDFLEQVVTLKINKREIANSFKNGIEVEGAMFVESKKPSLIIKRN